MLLSGENKVTIEQLISSKINAFLSPDFYIYNALSKETHIDQHKSHMAIWQKWLYGQTMAKLWPYGHITIYE